MQAANESGDVGCEIPDLEAIVVLDPFDRAGGRSSDFKAGEIVEEVFFEVFRPLLREKSDLLAVATANDVKEEMAIDRLVELIELLE